MGKLVYGVGVNDADYKVCRYEKVDGKWRHVWMCPFYRTWSGMLQRGHSENFKVKRQTYRDCTVCEEWHLFSTFRKWMEIQDYEGKELDKDLLFPQNKIYNPEACVFVSAMVNSFMLERGASRGKYKIGVIWDKSTGKFMAQCRNPFIGKGDTVGRFLTEQDAHEAWLARKLEYAYALAAIQTDERVAKALIDRYENWQDTSKAA